MKKKKAEKLMKKWRKGGCTIRLSDMTKLVQMGYLTSSFEFTPDGQPTLRYREINREDN